MWASVANADSYVLEEARDADFTFFANRPYAGSSSSFLIMNRGAARYFYRVLAWNEAGESPWSNVAWTDVCWEAEPNNTYISANGPLQSGIDYFGYPNLDIDSVSKDYYSIYLAASGRVVVDVNHHTGGGPQVQLFFLNTSQRVADDRSPPFHIDYTGPAGPYFIYISSGEPFGTDIPYTLRVTFP